jgi:hypothetical protein
MLRGRHQYKLQEINLLGGMIKPCGSPLSLVTALHYSKFLALRQCGFVLIAVFLGGGCLLFSAFGF